MIDYLQKLITWSAQKTASVAVADQDEKQRVGMRLAYIYLALDLALARDLALKYSLQIAHLYGIDLGIDYALLYAWLMADIFATIQDFDKVVKYVSKYQNYWSDILEIVEQFELDKATQQFMTAKLPPLTPPTVDAGQAAWRPFADRLLALMREERDIGREWNLSREQIQSLNTYFRASALLVECLKLAEVEDRAAIYARLLMPVATTD